MAVLIPETKNWLRVAESLNRIRNAHDKADSFGFCREDWKCLERGLVQVQREASIALRIIRKDLSAHAKQAKGDSTHE